MEEEEDDVKDNEEEDDKDDEDNKDDKGNEEDKEDFFAKMPKNNGNNLVNACTLHTTTT